MKNPSYKYVGKLVLDHEGKVLEGKSDGGPRPSIKCVSFTRVTQRYKENADDVIAVTGDDGTHLYSIPSKITRPKSMDRGWQRLNSWPELKGELCIWNPHKSRTRIDASFCGHLAVVTPTTETEGGSVVMLTRQHQPNTGFNSFNQETIYTVGFEDPQCRDSITDLLWGLGGEIMLIFKSGSQIFSMKWVKKQWNKAFVNYYSVPDGKLFGCCPSNTKIVFAACSRGRRIQVFRNYDGGAKHHWESIALGPSGLDTVKIAFTKGGDMIASLGEGGLLKIFAVHVPLEGEGVYGSLELFYEVQSGVPQSVDLQYAGNGVLILCGNSMNCISGFLADARRQLHTLEPVMIEKNKGIPPFDTVKFIAVHPDKERGIALLTHNNIITFWEHGEYTYEEIQRDLVFEKYLDHVPPSTVENTQLEGPQKDLLNEVANALKERADNRARREAGCDLLRPFLQKVCEGTSITNEEASNLVVKLYDTLRGNDDI